MSRPTNAEALRKKRQKAIEDAIATGTLTSAEVLTATKQLERIQFERLHEKPKFRRDAVDKKARRKTAAKQSVWGTPTPLPAPVIPQTPQAPSFPEVKNINAYDDGHTTTCANEAVTANEVTNAT